MESRETEEEEVYIPLATFDREEAEDLITETTVPPLRAGQVGFAAEFKRRFVLIAPGLYMEREEYLYDEFLTSAGDHRGGVNKSDGQPAVVAGPTQLCQEVIDGDRDPKMMPPRRSSIDYLHDPTAAVRSHLGHGYKDARFDVV